MGRTWSMVPPISMKPRKLCLSAVLRKKRGAWVSVSTVFSSQCAELKMNHSSCLFLHNCDWRPEESCWQADLFSYAWVLVLPLHFRLEAASCICVVWDGIAVWEVLVDVHGNIKSQQPILLQKIEHLKQVYKKYLSRALTTRRGLLIPSSWEEIESVQSDSI